MAALVLSENDLLAGERLCKECGLCCQGVFHTSALLYTDHDVNIIENENISVTFNKEKNVSEFILPCPVFTGQCSIYPERPTVCPWYKCDLLNAVLKSNTTLEDAFGIVIKIKNNLSTLLPELKRLRANDRINNPKYLINEIFDNLKSERAKEEFKKNNKKLFMIYGIFCLLEQRYFCKRVEE